MEIGYSQAATRLELDNTASHGVLTRQFMPRISKAIDMRF